MPDEKISEMGALSPAVVAAEFPVIQPGNLTDNFRLNLKDVLGFAEVLYLTSSVGAGSTAINISTLPTGVRSDSGWVVIDPYTVECEIRAVTGISGSQLTVAALAFNHATEDVVLWVTNPVANVKLFGAVGDGSTDDSPAFQAAHDDLPSIGGEIFVPSSADGYLINTQITCTKPTLLRIGNTTIVGPATGYLFEFQANDSGIEGDKDVTFQATDGCDGVIHNDQTLRCHYWNFQIDGNSVQNAILFFHDGGWYINVKNMHIDKDSEHATTDSISITSTVIGVPGPTGSFGGAFIGTYENIVCQTIRVAGDTSGAGLNVTTMTFVTIDAERFIASNADSLTFLQPILQEDPGRTGGSHFDLDTIAGVMCLGGDFEGGATRTVWTFGASCREIISIGNNTAGFLGTYMSGTPVAGSLFFDVGQTGEPDEEFRFGSLPHRTFQNSGWTDKHRIGLTFSGDTMILASNIRPTGINAGDLDNIASGGAVIRMNSSGQIFMQFATAGANPRVLTDVARFDAAGLTLTLPIDIAGQYLEGTERADPGAPAENMGRTYFRDNGGGKTQLVARFPTGAVQVIATEP